MKKYFMLIALVMALLLLSACGQKTVNLSDYTTVSFSGYNTRGVAEVVIDYDALAQVLQKKELESGNLVKSLKQGIQLDFEKETGLRNGEEFRITVNTDETLCERLKFSFKSDALSYTVTGLDEATLIDAFADVKVSFDGYAPYGYINFENLSDDVFVQNLTYRSDVSSGLSNGQAVTISVYCSDSLIDKFGCVPAETSRTYTVSGLGNYIENNDQLCDAALDFLCERSKVLTQKYMSSTYVENLKSILCGGGLSLSWSSNLSGTYEKELIDTESVYLLTVKEDAWGATNKINTCMVVGSVPVTLKENGETIYNDVAYMLFYYNDLVVDSDGSVRAKNGSGTYGMYPTKEACLEEINGRKRAYALWDEIPC